MYFKVNMHSSLSIQSHSVHSVNLLEFLPLDPKENITCSNNLELVFIHYPGTGGTWQYQLSINQNSQGNRQTKNMVSNKHTKECAA